MALKPTYCLDAADSITIEISQTDLKAILGQIETELHHSEVYCRVLAGLQNLMGEASVGAQSLVKAVGREAIRLAFRQLIQKHKITPEALMKVEAAVPVEKPPAPPLTTLSAQAAVEVAVSEPNSVDLSDPSALAANSETGESAAHSSSNGGDPTPLGPVKPTKKLSKAEMAAQMAAREREEGLRRVGQEIRQARQARSLSLHQVYSMTLVPVYHLEALELGYIDRLPEDIYIRGFIRRIGDALGLGGERLVASLPELDMNRAVLPTWKRPEEAESGGGIYLRPMHLYVGYAALMAGAVGGLTWLSQQTSPEAASTQSQFLPPQASVSQSPRNTAPKTTPGLKATQSGMVAGPDIAPPEAVTNFSN